tara:strand:+ start:587 stop:814 length:228 start_codon:yes stop_codon:yes gene_type:complete
MTHMNSEAVTDTDTDTLRELRSAHSYTGDAVDRLTVLLHCVDQGSTTFDEVHSLREQLMQAEEALQTAIVRKLPR